MRPLFLGVTAVGLLVFSAAPASAQPNMQMFQRLGIAFGKPMLLGQEPIQKELKLTEEQLGKLKGLGEKLGEKMQEAIKELFQGGKPDETFKKLEEVGEQLNKEVAGILAKDQNQRLNQLHLQSLERNQGMYVLLRYGGVAETLNITDEQKGKIQDLQDSGQPDIRQILRDAFKSGNRDEVRKKLQEANKALNDKILQVLDDEQRKKLKELIGEEFKGELRPFNFPMRPKPGS